MTGQEAYEEDRRRCPLYPHSGKPRPQWADLSDLIKSTWNKYPEPREYASKRETTRCNIS